MTREEMNLIRGFVANIQSLKDAHINDNLPINYGMLCTITTKGWELLKELKALEQQSEDAISRAETVQFLTNHSNDFEDAKIRMAFQTASSLVNNSHNLSSVQPKIKIGHWIYDYVSADGHKVYHCSECGCYLKPKHSEPLETFKYCNLCGAKNVPDIKDKKLSETPTGSESEDKE